MSPRVAALGTAGGAGVAVALAHVGASTGMCVSMARPVLAQVVVLVGCVAPLVVMAPPPQRRRRRVLAVGPMGGPESEGEDGRGFLTVVGCGSVATSITHHGTRRRRRGDRGTRRGL